MKQNDSFLLQELAGVPYLLPYGQMIASHRRGLKTNATGAYLWNLLEEEHSLEEILHTSAIHYGIPKEALDEFNLEISAFLTQLKAYDILTDTSCCAATGHAGNTALSVTNGTGSMALSATDGTGNTECTTLDRFGSTNHNATDRLRTVLAQLNDSRAKALSSFGSSGRQQDGINESCNISFSIGGILLTYHGPETAFPPEFEPFCTADTSGLERQTVLLHPYLPKETPHGKLLLQNFELNIIEQADAFLLHFPRAKHHLELHLSKEGHTVHCYSLPPYNAEFHYDFFHALRLTYLYLAQKHTMAALHSASILYRDRLWLFSGPSGMGKSTHTGLWNEQFHTPVINGDLNLLAIKNGTPVVHGIPWCGTSGIRSTKTYPLGGILLLERDTKNFVEELSPDQKLLFVTQRLVSPSWTKEQWKKNLDIVTQATADCLVCKLHCTKEPEAAEVMKKKIDAFLSVFSQ